MKTKKILSVMLASCLVFSLAGCSKTNETTVSAQTSVSESSDTSSDITDITAVSSGEATSATEAAGWEYLLDNMSDEEVADLVFNMVSGFHLGMSIDDWYSVVGKVPATVSNANKLDYKCLGYSMGQWPSNDYVKTIELQYMRTDDGTVQVSDSNRNIAKIDISLRFVDEARAKHIYTLLKEKFAAVTNEGYHEDEDSAKHWQTYAFSNVEGYMYDEAWRVKWGGSNEESIQQHADGMSEYDIEVWAFLEGYPGLM